MVDLVLCEKILNDCVLQNKKLKIKNPELFLQNSLFKKFILKIGFL